MVVGKSKEVLFCLDSDLSFGTNSNANINKNNEYIPPKEDNDNKEMIKTLQDIIKKKQNKMFSNGDNFDKQLKKYFDKCVIKEQKKEIK